MRIIPTAVNFIINKLEEIQPNSNEPPTPKEVEEWMIEFAKMHFAEALKKSNIIETKDIELGHFIEEFRKYADVELKNETRLSAGLFGNLDKYFENLQHYEDELYCSHCSNHSKKTFTYSRTVANGEVFFCHRCKEENLVG